KARREAEEQAKKEAELAAKEKTKREAGEQAKKEAELAAREKARREAEVQARKEAELVPSPPMVFDQVKPVEECLKELESICEELRAGEVETKEALQRLLDISERIAE
ncbi:translation initiation factor IF-2, partial [Chloroflexota bacterium]